MESFIRNVDGGRLKTQLNKIMADVNVITAGAGAGDAGGGAAAAAATSAKGTEEAGRCLLEFAHFFGSVAEQHGTTPHAVLGQHVVANVFVFALERIVKPSLLTYCRFAEKHASSAMVAAATLARTASSGRSGGGVGVVPRRDALEARRRRLRGDIIRPFSQLFQTLHASLAAEGEPLTAWGFTEGGSAGSSSATTTSGAAAGAGGTTGLFGVPGWDGAVGSSRAATRSRAAHADEHFHRRGGAHVGGALRDVGEGEALDGGGDDVADGGAGGLADGDDVVAAADGLSQAPLLWKNASPLNLLCNHILEVLESQWLVSVVGADYVQLLMEVLRWAGYARLVTPTYLVRLAQCLVSLVERVRVGEDELGGGDGGGGGGGESAVGRAPPQRQPHGELLASAMPGLVAEDVGDGRIWVARPSADDACVYAQALSRLFTLPQVTAAFPATAASSASVSTGLTLVQRVLAIVQERHQQPTPDLRLEAYLIAALRHLCWRFRYDQPAAAQAPTAVVKLLCDFFFLPCHTPRHDVWRLEAMQFLALVLSVAFADVVGEELWRDLQARALDDWHDAASARAGDAPARSASSSSITLMTALEQPAVRQLVALLHQSVLPTTLRIFTQPRHEYSFVSRREVFSSPCATLQEVFDFGAVVVYLAGVTHATYVAWRAASDAAPARKRERDADGAGAGPLRGHDPHGTASHDAPPAGVVHPVQLVADALQAEFFLAAAPLEGDASAGARGRSAASSAFLHAPPVRVDAAAAAVSAHAAPVTSASVASSSAGSSTRRRAGAPPLVLRMGTSGLRTNSAAVQEVVSDAALFLLHLLAQPCTALRAPVGVVDALVEDVLLPLSGHFGLRLGPLLFAAVAAVLPRCSRDTRRFLFAAVAQRSLPAASPSSPGAPPPPQWRGAARGVEGAAAATLSLEIGQEEQLSPSEPAYRVLVGLLEQHLHRRHDGAIDAPDAPFSTESFVHRGPSDSRRAPSLTGGLRLAWSAHPRGLIQRSVAQLHAWERDVRLRIATETSAPDVALPPTGAVRSQASTATVTAVHRGLVTAPLALLLLRFTTLLQCAELHALVHDGVASAAEGDSVGGERHLAFLSDAPSAAGQDGDVGLGFACHVAAHGVHFFHGVPVLAHHASSEQQVGSAGLNVDGGGVHRRTAAPQRGDEALTIMVNSGPYAARVHGSAAATLFGASHWLAWLDAAELYACTALRTHLARAQLQRHAELTPSTELHGSRYDTGIPSGTSMHGHAGAHISGALRRDVVCHVEAVCGALDAALTAPATHVPAVLRDAVDAYWVLRLPLRQARTTTGSGQSPDARHSLDAAETREVNSAETPPAAAVMAAHALDGEASAASLSRSFQLVLTASAAPAAVWLMRRVQLQERLRLTREQDANVVSGGACAESRDVPLLANTGDTTSSASTASAALAALQLTVQCVQTLHLLVRWRRARLWAPPQEGSTAVGEPESDDDRDAGDFAGSATTPATGAPISATADDPLVRAAAGVERDGDGLDGGEEGTYNAARRGDLRLLHTSPDLYAAPEAMLRRFSALGGGRLYYAVLWLCHHVRLALEDAGPDAGGRAAAAAPGVAGAPPTRYPGAVAVVPLPLWAALRLLFHDVGSVLLEPAFSCIDPGQGILRFTSAVTRHLLHAGVLRISRWRPSNPTSREVAHVMASALPLALDTLRLIVYLSEATGVVAVAAEPLTDTAALHKALLAVLQEQSLIDAAAPHGATARHGGAGGRSGGDGAAELGDALLPATHRLLDMLPFLPPVLSSLPAVLRLLPLLHLECAATTTADAPHAAPDTRAAPLSCQAAVMQLLQVCFTRFRFQLGPGLCSALLCGSLADVARLCGRSLTTTAGTHMRRAPAQRQQQLSDATARFLFHNEGRLVELWTAQLTDPARTDMPVCTPAWQCALLQAAFAVLPRCEPAVAEVLGRFSFEFLAERTPHAVRQHAARQVGYLFRTFSSRRAQVLHTLLTKAREGMLSPTRTLCTTSLLALSEAVRAAPEMLVEVLYTLLECWAMRGFTHRPLILECLQRMAAWVLADANGVAVVASSTSVSAALPHVQLCRMYARHVLFAWLCEYRHPLAALPVECFGYTTLEDFVHAHLGMLLPLALLLATEATDADDVEEGGGEAAHRDRPSLSCRPRVGAGRPASGRDDGAQLYEQVLAVYAEGRRTAGSSRDNVCADGPGGRRGGRARTEGIGSQPTSAGENDHPHHVGAASPPPSQQPQLDVDHGGVVRQDAEVDDARRRRGRLAPMCLLVEQLPATLAQLLVLAAHTPVSLFAGTEGANVDLSDEEKGGSGAVDSARLPWQSAAVGAHGGGHRRSDVHPHQPPPPPQQQQHGGRGSGAEATPAWASVAQRCLYWLEAQLNTADARDVALCVQLVHGDRAVLPTQDGGSSAAEAGEGSGASSSGSLAAAQAALRDPATCASAKSVLRCYLLHMGLWPTRRPVFDTLIAAHTDAVMECLVALHRTRDEPAALAYGAPHQLQRALAWVAARLTALPLPPAAAFRTASTEGPAHCSRDTAGAVIVVDATPPMPSRQYAGEAATAAAARACEARCLAFLVPPAPAARCGDDDVMSRDGDALTQLFLAGRGTFLHALLHRVYRSGTCPSSPELLLRGPQQLALLAQVCTRWCSAAVLGSPPTLRLVLTCLLHWLRRSESHGTRELVCRVLLHVWPVAHHVHSRRNSAAVGSGGPRAAEAHEFCECRRLLARAVSALAASSALVASTWRALCRTDAGLSGCDWQQRARAYLEDSRRMADSLAPEAAAAGDGGSHSDGMPAAHTGKDDVVDVDATAAAAEENEGGDAHAGRVADATADSAVPSPADVRHRSWAAYTAQREACCGALCDARTQARLRRLLPLLRHVAGLREELGAAPGEDGHGAVGGDAEGVFECCLDRTWTASATAFTPPSVLRDIATAVDAAPALLARCIAVAAVCVRRGHANAAAARRAEAGALLPLLPAECLAVRVRTAMLHAIPRLYAVCVGDGAAEVHATLGGCSAVSVRADPVCEGGVTAVADVVAAGASSGAADALDSGVHERLHEAHALAALRLLRALAQCAVAGGESFASLLRSRNVPLAEVDAEKDVDSEQEHGNQEVTGASRCAPTDGTAEELVAAALANAYSRLVRSVEALLWCAEPGAAERAMGSLRVWALCLHAVGGSSSSTNTALSPFDDAITQLVLAQPAAVLPPADTAVEGAGVESRPHHAPSTEARAHAAVRSLLLWVTRSGDGRSASTVDVAADSATLRSPAQVLLTSSAVWAPLRHRHRPVNEHAFLCRFVMAAANTFGVWRRSLLWTALLPLLQCELQYAERQWWGSAEVAAAAASTQPTSTSALASVECNGDGADAGRYIVVAELLLLPLFLHALCLRESDAQRATRAAWSRLLEEHVLTDPQRCPRLARLFLRVLHQCHVVLLRATRQRGLKGFAASAGGGMRVRAAAAAAAVASATDNLVSPFNAVDGAATSSSAADAVIAWPSALGAVPTLQDMQECYWLSDIAADVLARAAAAVHEPQLALLFSQLSGESLFGARTGAATLCGPADTTRSVVMLWRGGAGTAAAAATAAAAVDAALNPSFGAPYSVLFPFAAREDYPSAASSRHRAGAAAAGAAGASSALSRSGLRARERQDAVRQQTAAFAHAVFHLYAAVQPQMEVDDVVGIAATVRSAAELMPAGSRDGGVCGFNDGALGHVPRLPGGSLHDARGSEHVIRRSRTEEPGRSGEPGEGGINGFVSASEGGGRDGASGAWLDAVRRLEEREAAARSFAVGQPQQHAAVVDGWAAQLRRAALLLHHDLPATALDVLLSVRPSPGAAVTAAPLAGPSVDEGPALATHPAPLKQRAPSAAQPNNAEPSPTAGTAAVAPWTAAHEASLRSLLAEAAWKCGRWGSVPLVGPASAGGGSSVVPEHPLGHTVSATHGGRAQTAAGLAAVTCVPRAVMERLTGASDPCTRGASAAGTLSAADGGTDGFYVHLLFAFVTLTQAQPRVALQHVRRAELALRRQLSATTFAATMLAAEALSEVRACAAQACAASAEVSQAAVGRVPGRRGARGLRAAASAPAGALPAWLLRQAGAPRPCASAPLGSEEDGASTVVAATEYPARRVWHAVRHALCQVYGDGEAWYRVMLQATEDALLHHDAATAQRWLTDWEAQHASSSSPQLLLRMPPGSAAPSATSLWHGQGDAAARPAPAALDVHRRQMDVMLRKAQAAYGLGRWREALALLQPPALITRSALEHASTSPAAAATAGAAAALARWHPHCNGVDWSSAPSSAPQDARVVQQLMVWHSELQLVPPSHLVRDPFLSRAAASDMTGACSFLLARLCHALADGIAQRVSSHEQQQVRASVEASRHLKAELEAQLEQATHPTATAALMAMAPPSSAGGRLGTGTDARGGGGAASGSNATTVMPGRGGAAAAAVAAVILSDDQLRVVRRRIRELAADIKRQEEEWQSDKSNYGLYRRSAINAYSRFLQFHHQAAAAAHPCNEGRGGVGAGPGRSAAAGADGAASRAPTSGTTAHTEAVRCVPADPQEDIVHAVFGFVELWLNDADVEQGGGAEVLGKVLSKAVERIPTAVFVPLASQLTAQLGGPAEGGRLAVLVARMARDYPVHVVWPLLALCHGHTFAKSRDVNALHCVDEVKIAAARQLLTDLAATSQAHAGRSGAASDEGGAARLATLVQQAQLLSEAYLELAFDRSAATAQTDKRHPIRRDMQLLQSVRNLSIPPPSSIDLSAAPLPGTAFTGPVLRRYQDYFTTPGGVNVPKVLLCELSDGTVVRQLLKAGDDLRQDALIEQLFSTANSLFARRPTTRPLRVRTFTIVPLSPAAGILQWVERTTPLGEYLTGRLAGKHELPGAHERYFPGEPATRECRMRLQSAAPSAKPQVLLGLYETFTPALHYFFLETYTSAAVWVARQQSFTRSVAASSMMGYIVGLGDRHINNILLHRGTAEVVHIDLGIAFDQSRLLPVPELVPFRLTRNMIDGLGVRGTEGSLRPCAEAALHLLRGKRELMCTILGSIMHDPLARWAIGPVQPPQPPPRQGGAAAALDESARQVAPLRRHGSSADAARTLARIEAKLRGYDGGDVLSVPTQVRKLVEEAQRVESLAMMFPGWSQWV